MWRPVALSAFLALLFVSSRSGQQPVETNSNDTKKSDFGAQTHEQGTDPDPIEIDFARSSVHPKAAKPADEKAAESGSPDVERPPAHREPAGEERSDEIQIADLDISGRQIIPLPSPKAGTEGPNIRVVVTQGEQKTALTSGDEALSLMPQGPDFAARVQKELARLGCYHGRVDNIWGPMSRNAVARFNRVAKAKIPLKQPTRALLSSARKAPDGYCKDGASAKVASLDPGDSLEALKKRPDYLPPWMRGEPMPEPDENRVVSEEEQEAEKPKTQVAARQEPSVKPKRARRAEQRVRRAQRQRAARRTSSFQAQLKRMGWPGQ